MRWWWGALAVALAIVSTPVRAEDKPLAEALFLEGQGLWKQGQYEAACEKFEASHVAEPSVGALLNIARCHQREGNIASAWSEYKEAAALADRKGQPERKAGALEFVAELEPRLSRLTVEVETPVEGLVVRRGDVVLPPGSFGVAAPVDPGSYTITAQAPGHESFTTEIAIAGESERTVVTIPPLVPTPAGEVSVPPRSTGLPPVAVAGIVVAGIGVASLGVGIAFGVIAIGDEGELAMECPDMRCSPMALERRDDIEIKAHVSTATLIIGGAALAGGALMFLLAPRDTTESPLNAVPILTPDYQGVSVRGWF